jgi:hypothetical protein
MTMNVTTTQTRRQRETAMVEMMGNDEDDVFDANACSRVPGNLRLVDRSARAPNRTRQGE